MALQFWLDGTWDLEDYPETILVGDRIFRRARWRKRYPGVVEQYREAVPRHSMHMKVYEDDTWKIDHIDEFNPDMGLPVRALRHFLHDHPVARAGRPGVILASIFWRPEEE